MIVRDVDFLDDPRVALYRNLKDRELAREGDLFIAEGEHVVRRLLASDHEVVSALVGPRRLDAVAPLFPPGVPVYAVSDALVRQVLGFKFHSGVMAIGKRPPPRRITDVVRDVRGLTILVCPQIINHENLGALIRIAAAFGVDAFVVGPGSCDPYWRRSIRVSMGTIFSIRLVRSLDFEADLGALRRAGVELVATVLDKNAQPLARSNRTDRLALLFGNESQGLDEKWTNLCDRKVTIPMRLGTDSLNVAVAAAVFLYHFTSPAISLGSDEKFPGVAGGDSPDSAEF